MLKLENTAFSIKSIIAAAIWVAVAWSISQLVVWITLDVALLPETYLIDYLAHLSLGALLFLLCRSWWAWATAFGLLTLVFHVCNALKLTILGTPIMPDDFISVKNMFHLFGGWRLVAMWLALILPIVTLIFAINLFSRRAIATLILTVITVICFVQWPASVSAGLDSYFGNSVWNQPANFKERGLIVYLVQESARHLSKGRTTISKEEALTAFSSLNKNTTAIDNAAKINHKRNVYAILLESFWDPTPLHQAGISQDPIDPRFRKLWKQTAYSVAMDPVFGGYTANSEFEVLCGFPVNVDSVFFEGWLRNQAPCLPRYLSKAGYHTITAHPNYAGFWNRVNAYNRIGFDSYWAQLDFNLDDMNKEFLGDASLYQQMWDKMQTDFAAKTPIFAHIVTFFGHVDYPLNELRPKFITVKNDPNLVEEYVNQIYYKSRELMDFIERLKKEDPEALIVMYGDHLPYLGPNYDGYVQSGLLARAKTDFTPQMFQTYITTPLVVIDGKKGPVSVGQLPLYQLPSLMLKLLNDEGHSIVNLTSHSPIQSIRPLPGITLVAEDKHNPYSCMHEAVDATCSRVNQWLNQVMTVATDIFSGEQYSLSNQPTSSSD